MVLKFDSKYFLYAIVLFFIEVLIALYVNDTFVRPYVGDFLVVMLLYCMIKSLLDANTQVIALSVLLFSYLIETLQYFRIVEILGLESYPIANVVIGTSFAWIDILAYTLGVLTILMVERRK